MEKPLRCPKATQLTLERLDSEERLSDTLILDSYNYVTGNDMFYDIDEFITIELLGNGCDSPPLLPRYPYVSFTFSDPYDLGNDFEHSVPFADFLHGTYLHDLLYKITAFFNCRITSNGLQRVSNSDYVLEDATPFDLTPFLDKPSMLEFILKRAPLLFHYVKIHTDNNTIKIPIYVHMKYVECDELPY